MNKVRPSKEAMLICDHIITEAGTNKKSLIGIFEHIFARQLPHVHAVMNVYIKFTGVIGQYQFRIDLVDLKTDEIVGKGVLPRQNFKDKLMSYELLFRLRNLRFKNEGKYEFRIYADDEVFGTKTFSIMKPAENPKSQP